ncbi:L,D-transpeptidase [Paracoccus sp. (in: a-proteobacteria)]|uniref:L,D-transpeptidase family protein n=1 Tax=Paracoccus sp. TaxID=267 RepID=UPI0026DF60E0|nr:L,D-transpeptidase [Paracoccus sp. (in: a-proteobacteria)]MDO5370409.1 L,D-transpeptidase [Paracoccus sp. (in: a-proteobacteria)]
MPRPTALRLLPMLTAAMLMLSTALPAAAQSKRADIGLADIEAATYPGRGDLPPGQSALTAKVQILLDRSGVSPGIVDGFRGGMSKSAVRAFERMHGLPQDGVLDPQVWALLQRNAGSPLTSTYTIAPADAEGLVDRIPTDYAEKAQMPSMGYTSVLEKLAERFHMDEKFLAQLNPGASFAPGEVINVTVPAKPIRATALRVIVDAERRRVAAYDAGGRMVADYPATVGSSATPSPQGTHLVEAAVMNPDYTYNPSINFKQGENDKVLRIPPGPNAPVGNVWIDLSKPTYGIHGTPNPSQLFVNQSNGCVRLTNWDAQELAKMVVPGQTVVDFLPPGVTIADVTPAVEPAALPDAAGTTITTAVQDAAAPAMVTASRPVPRRALPGAVPSADAPLAVAVEAAVAAAAGAPLPVQGTDPLASALSGAANGALNPQPYTAPAGAAASGVN